jgi:hypothetical protein
VTLLVGCDFSSAPNRRKPIVVALGEGMEKEVRLQSLLRFDSLAAWGCWLAKPGDWVGGFDFPFGLPRELVEHEGWPTDWLACMRHYATLPRGAIRVELAAFCEGRPVGRKFAHRATDGPAGSSSSMKWVNPPVAMMLHAGIPALLDAGVHLPGLHDGDERRVALEAYPGLLAREMLGRSSYKSDDRQRQTPERRLARQELLLALEQGRTRLGLRLTTQVDLRDVLLDDASGDSLDAVLCLVQAGWALRAFKHGDARYGLPAFDPLEGWIVTAR